MALGGQPLVDEAGGFAVAYHAARGSFFVLRHGTDLLTEIDPATGAALRSMHLGIDGGDYYGGLTVHPTRGTLLLGNRVSVVEVDPANGQLLGTYDPISNGKLSSVDMSQEGVSWDNQWNGYLTGLAFDAAGKLWGSTNGSGGC